MTVTPYPGEIEEARRHPDGHVYRIAVRPKDAATDIPAEAIVGAWKVDASGVITGAFIPNPKYDAEKYPPGSSI